jgi:NAD(P)H-dependent FMN reductase
VTKRLLVVHHTVSPATHAVHLAVMAGAQDPAIEGVEVMARPALIASAVEVMEADGYLIGCPVNLGYLSGAVKHFFDQVYYPCIDATQGRPYAAYLHSNSDSTGALRALDSITAGLRWRRAQAALVVSGDPSSKDLDAARELGSAVAAELILG